MFLQQYNQILLTFPLECINITIEFTHHDENHCYVATIEIRGLHSIHCTELIYTTLILKTQELL